MNMYFDDKEYDWPYEVNYGKEVNVEADVVILGGGLAGTYAAIAAARKGLSVALVDKSAVIHSGAGGTGIDHFSCPLNPASKINIDSYLASRNEYNNFIIKYILAMDSYECLLEMEKMGIKMRDTEDDFKGAEFRDEETKLLFAFDHENNHTIRFWGRGMKPGLYKEAKKLGVKMYERIMVTSLLTEDGKVGGRVIGATGLNTHTGEFYIFKGKAVVLCMSTPDRLFHFSSEWVGLIGRDGPPTNIGDGHAMAWRAGAEFTKMEHTSHEEWGGSTGIGSVLFGSGTCFATWYPCTIVDADGKEIPWVDTLGHPIKTSYDRTHPRPEEGFFTLVLGKGEGAPGAFPVMIPDLQEKIKKGEYKLPLYADLPGMPEPERRAIFGLMVGNEGTTYPVYRNLTKAGFDPDKDQLQVYEMGPSPIGWRRLRYGGLLNDWKLMTSLPGLFAAGQQLYDGCGCTQALSTGRWCGSMAAEYAKEIEFTDLNREQIDKEKERVYAPLTRSEDGINWKELETGISKVLQDYCGDRKTEELMKIGLIELDEIKRGEMQTLWARNPHELMRALEAESVLTCAEMVIYASMARKASSDTLSFERIDYPEMDPEEWNKWVVTKMTDHGVEISDLPLDYYGDLKEEYEKLRPLVARTAEWRPGEPDPATTGKQE